MHYTICDFISDLVANAVEAKSKLVVLDFIQNENIIEVLVSDNGKGMNADLLKKAQDPFYSEVGKHSKRRVGLGLPFLIQAIQLVDGNFEIKSDEQVGTSVFFSFDFLNIDSPPIGDWVEMVLGLMTFSADYDLLINKKVNNKKCSIQRSLLVEALGELETVESLCLLKQYVKSNDV